MNGAVCAGEKLPFNGDSAMAQDDTIVATMRLNSVLLRTLVGRRRRRLRHLASDNKVHAQIDRVGSQLRICGTAEDVGKVWSGIRNLGSSLKQLSDALWTELMRTRKSQNCSLVAWLQGLSGARVHIERGQMEVRIFGAEDNIAAAADALDLLEQDCVERSVPIGADTVGGQEAVAAMADHFEVTIRADQARLLVLGRRLAVSRCVNQLYKMCERAWLERGYLDFDARVLADKQQAATAEPPWTFVQLSEAKDVELQLKSVQGALCHGTVHAVFSF